MSLLGRLNPQITCKELIMAMASMSKESFGQGASSHGSHSTQGFDERCFVCMSAVVPHMIIIMQAQHQMLNMLYYLSCSLPKSR